MPTRIGSMHCPQCERQVATSRETANHLLHAFLTFCMCGFWLPIWILSALSPGPERCNVCGSMSRSAQLSSNLVRFVVYGFTGLIAFAALSGYVFSRATKPKPTNQATAAQPAPTAEAPPAAESKPAPIEEPPADDKQPRSTDKRSPDSFAETDIGQDAATEAFHREQAEKAEAEKAAQAAAIVKADEDAQREKAKYRTWTAANGKHTIEAQFKSAIGKKIKLEKPDGSIVEVTFDKLSDVDQAFIRNRRKP